MLWKPKLKLTNVLLCILSCGLALCLAEGLMRVAADKLLAEGEFIAVGTVFKLDDPPMGYGLQPNTSRIVAKGKAFVMKERISHQGLRDVEHSMEKQSGKQRILVLGDSFMYGDGVAMEETMARQLARLTADFEIINAGVRAYDLGQEYLHYKHRVRRFQPDLVLLAFFINDIAPDPTVRAVDGADGLPLFYERKPEVVVRERKEAPRGMRGLASSWLRSHSMIYVLLRKRLNDWEVRRRAPRDSKRDNVSDVFYLEAFRAGPDTAPISKEWSRTYKILDELKRLVASDGAQLRVMVIPTPWQTSQEEWTRWVSWLGVEPDSLARLKPQEMVRAWCERSGTPCLDVLQECDMDERSRIYFRNDSHWTAEGHLQAARCLRPFLTAMAHPRRRFKKCARDFTSA